MNTLKMAIDLAKKEFAGVTRKDGKTPYFTHLEAVAQIVDQEWFTLIPTASYTNWGSLKQYVIEAAYLHDIIEDRGFSVQDLKDMGFSELTAEIVGIVSRRQDENYFDFIMRIHDSGPFRVGAVAVKLADLKHNTSDLKEGSLKDKYRLAYYILNTFNQ